MIPRETKLALHNLVLSVCVSVCLSLCPVCAITFKSFDLETLFLLLIIVGSNALVTELS